MGIILLIDFIYIGGFEMNLYAYLFVILAAMLWGTVGTTQALLENVSPFSVAFIRSLIGGGVLLIGLLIMRKIDLKKWTWKWTILAAFFIACFQVTFFHSVLYTGVAIGTVITIGSSPIFAGVIQWLVFKQRINRMWGIATGLSITGVILLFTNGEVGQVDLLGVLLALVAGLLFASYTSASKRLMEKEQPLQAVAMTFTFCALYLSPFTIQDGFGWLTISTNIGPILFMAFAATTLAYVLFLLGLKKVSSASAVTLSLAEPIMAALLGVIVLREHLPLISWVGIFVILSSIIVITITDHQTTKI